ncbi:NAD(+) diphosphatase [Permianibacter aggregans]|uniref:NAD(+) diphosphatase n=1 Tax=Permianibacter aggregans TaxID=1510150 RepID=A0A4R6V370_9GAMM|nr:NAD(+) diphosphatase [Permianibacter aggregans]QGX38780.1 NAD(+) diphosphatase [Permianibacter aggregans]TDQ50584.1 NAD+ diphosphatase [Permianibacter aggregans]
MDIFFSLQRESLQRRNPERLQTWQNDTNARVMLVHDGQLSIAAEPHYRSLHALTAQQQSELILLGLYRGLPTFALRVEQAQFHGEEIAWGDLRQCAHLLDAETLSIAIQAKALCHWHQTHPFCARCGKPTVMKDAGYRRLCEHCQAEHFPRCDPAVIVGVQFNGQLLLGRQSGWPEKRYSVIAGFAEPGESLEQAVVREVMEETGIRVETVRYLQSQPWPYPSSLMLAFMAEAEHDEIELRDQELENARWVSRESLQSLMQAGEIKLPPRASIAYQIIRQWYEQEGADFAALIKSIW